MLSFNEYQRLPVADRSSILKNYYVDMLKKYCSGSGKVYSYCLSGFWYLLFLFLFFLFIFFIFDFFCLATITEIDSATSSVIRDANLLTLIKKTTDNNNKNYTTKLVAEKFDRRDLLSQEISGERVWKEPGFFGDLRADYNMEKVNLTENSLIFINQAYLTIQKNKNIFYCNYFSLGQIIEASNLPNDLEKYELQDREVKYFRHRHNTETGEFLGLYETIGLLVVRGDALEIFLNYGFDNKMSKVLYSNYRRKIPDSFCGTMFNRHKTLVECGETEMSSSYLYFFLPSITDRSETVNQNLNNVSISPLNIKQEQLNTSADNVVFKPNKLDYHDVDTKAMSDAVVKCLKHIAAVLNSNLMRNADSLLCRKDVNVDVKWISGVNRSTPTRCKLSY